MLITNTPDEIATLFSFASWVAYFQNRSCRRANGSQARAFSTRNRSGAKIVLKKIFSLATSNGLQALYMLTDPQHETCAGKNEAPETPDEKRQPGSRTGSVASCFVRAFGRSCPGSAYCSLL